MSRRTLIPSLTGLQPICATNKQRRKSVEHRGVGWEGEAHGFPVESSLVYKRDQVWPEVCVLMAVECKFWSPARAPGGLDSLFIYFFLLLFFFQERKRLESGKGKFKKLSRLLVSYQEADPAKLEEDTPSPQHYILFMNPPSPVFVHNHHSDSF